MTNCCICIQCFNKPNETQLVLKSLEKCENVKMYNLLIFVDKANKESKSFLENTKLIQILAEYVANSQHIYSSIDLIVSKTNLGPYKACYECIELGLKKNKFVIFSEDDILFCKDTLNYFSSVFNTNEFSDESCIGVSSSSVYFGFKLKSSFSIVNGQIVCEKIVDDQKCILKNKIVQSNYLNNLLKVNWAPNKQFGFNREKWDRIKFFRTNEYLLNKELNTCAPDHATGKFVKSNNLHFLFSVIPRSNDIGLYNELGCTSLYFKGLPSPDTIKILTSDDFELSGEPINLSVISNPEFRELQQLLSSYNF